MHLAPALAMTPVGISSIDLCRQKTRVTGYRASLFPWSIRLAVLIALACNEHLDGQTQRHSIQRTSIASRVKHLTVLLAYDGAHQFDFNAFTTRMAWRWNGMSIGLATKRSRVQLPVVERLHNDSGQVFTPSCSQSSICVVWYRLVGDDVPWLGR